MPAVTLATLESHNHIVGDINRGVKIYNLNGIKFEESELNFYLARVPHEEGSFKTVTVTFSRDGMDIVNHSCNCTREDKNPPICCHVIAAVLAIQGGVVETKLTLGKAVSVKTIVSENNTAKTVGSGSLDVFATPAMIALMERAACECLTEGLKPGETSVGTGIEVLHTAASPLGAKITVTAAIKHIMGRRIEFNVTACDKAGEIGHGEHTRVIVDAERFSEKTRGRR